MHFDLSKYYPLQGDMRTEQTIKQQKPHAPSFIKKTVQRSLHKETQDKPYLQVASCSRNNREVSVYLMKNSFFTSLFLPNWKLLKIAAQENLLDPVLRNKEVAHN